MDIFGEDYSTDSTPWSPFCPLGKGIDAETVRKRCVQPSTGPSGMLVAGEREMGPKRLTWISRPPGWHSEDQLPGVRLSSAGEEGRKGVGSQEQESPSQIYDGGGGACTSHPRVAMQSGGQSPCDRRPLRCRGALGEVSGNHTAIHPDMETSRTPSTVCQFGAIYLW